MYRCLSRFSIQNLAVLKSYDIFATLSSDGLSYGVMVTQQILVLSFWVRVPIAQHQPYGRFVARYGISNGEMPICLPVFFVDTGTQPAILSNGTWRLPQRLSIWYIQCRIVDAIQFTVMFSVYYICLILTTWIFQKQSYGAIPYAVIRIRPYRLGSSTGWSL